VLIDDRLPPRGDDSGRLLEPNWRAVGWLALAGALGFGAARTGGAVTYLIVCAIVYAASRAAVELVDYAGGLREWRQ
jgi:hypothetical protein